MLRHQYVLLQQRIGGFSGDQFYVRRDFLEEKKGGLAVAILQLRSAVMRSGPVVLTSRLFRKLRFVFAK